MKIMHKKTPKHIMLDVGFYKSILFTSQFIVYHKEKKKSILFCRAMLS